MSCHVPPPQLYTSRRSWMTKPMSSCMGVPWTGLKSGIVTEHDTSHNFRDVFIIIFTFQTTCLLLFCSFVCSRYVHRASFRLVRPSMLPMLSDLKDMWWAISTGSNNLRCLCGGVFGAFAAVASWRPCRKAVVNTAVVSSQRVEGVSSFVNFIRGVRKGERGWIRILEYESTEAHTVYDWNVAGLPLNFETFHLWITQAWRLGTFRLFT